MTTVEFEGSDDWIRLNFKWYLYTMLASIVREEACARLKLELENLIFSSAAASFSSSSSSAASSASHSGGDNSSSAGSTSLENEVVNIDDYIDRVTNTTKTPSNGSPVVRRVARRGSEKNKSDPNTTTPTKFDTTTPRKKVCQARNRAEFFDYTRIHWIYICIINFTIFDFLYLLGFKFIFSEFSSL